MSSRELITIFLSLTAFFELAGTLTVAINYDRTNKVVEQLIDNPDQFDKFRERRRFNSLAQNLKRKPYLTAGLVAYFLGAISGLLAGLAALYHW